MKKYEIYERIAPLNNIVIASSEFMSALQGIINCMERSQAYGEPVGSILTSLGGLGKTTLCRTILSQMPKNTRKMEGYDKTIIPAFYTEVPAPVTVKSLASTMLQKLGDPTHLHGTTDQLTNRLIYLLDQCETKLVLLDEFHHLFDRKSAATKLNINVGNWLKNLVNKTGISFCLIGLPEFVDLLEVDSQIARRFQHRFKLSPLSIGTIKNPDGLYHFLNQLALQAQERTHITFNSDLDSHLLGMQIFLATSGFHAYVMALVRESIAIALSDGRTVVTVNDFSCAWHMGITSFISLAKTDPFQMSLAQLATVLRSDKK